MIVCDDAREHLINPRATLKQLRLKLKPEGVVVASIPNIRDLPALSKVPFRKHFPQQDFGNFDRTHLRCFTRKSMVRMFKTAGFTMRRINGINRYYSPSPRADCRKLRILRRWPVSSVCMRGVVLSVRATRTGGLEGKCFSPV